MNQIEIRMYNVGFGDSFLLKIPTTQGVRHVLVDCGFHSQGKGKFSDRELVEQIRADLNDNALDVVVATHRHQDHISGFGETDLWAQIPVSEVWLPFTASPEAVRDEPTLAAWNAFLEQAHNFWDNTGNLTPAALSQIGARDAAEVTAAGFMLWNARANAPAINNLLHELKRADGQSAKRRFLPERKDAYPWQFETSVLPGVKIHVLGPPTDPKYRKNLKVPTSWGMDGETSKIGTEIPAPAFSSEWQIPIDHLPTSRPFQDKTLRTIQLFNDDLFYAAKAVDRFLNGESIVLVLEVGSARLLLPGDAEVGSWTMIMKTEAALDLVASATFLKIGHHGSHNATPISLIRDHISKQTLAMISTQAGEGAYRHGIPYNVLLEAMTSRMLPFVRSDISLQVPSGVFTQDPQERWIDCLIPC